MGTLAAYLYFFEPFYPQVDDPVIIDNILSFFPLRNFDGTWDSKDSKPNYSNRRV